MAKKFDPKAYAKRQREKEIKIERDRKNKKDGTTKVLAMIDAMIKEASDAGNRAYHDGERIDLIEARYRISRVATGTSRRPR